MRESPHYKNRYRIWSGNRAGRAPDYDRCCSEVPDGGRSMLSHQCNNGRGNGPDQAYCSIHDPAVISQRLAKSNERFKIKLRRDSVSGMQKAVDALLLIEAGHNDPRALAKETLDEYRAKDWWSDKP